MLMGLSEVGAEGRDYSVGGRLRATSGPRALLRKLKRADLKSQIPQAFRFTFGTHDKQTQRIGRATLFHAVTRS